MASIIISNRVKSLLSDDDRFELKIHSTNKIDETITIISDGDLFTFTVLKSSDRDPDTFINTLYSSSACRIELLRISELEYQITQIFTKLGDPVNTELFKPEPEVTPESEIPPESVVEPEAADTAKSAIKAGGVRSKAGGCSFRRIDRQY